MPLPTATKNAALNGLTFTHFSLHSGYPGSTGANELTGGGYTRLAAVVNTASGGQRLLNAALTFTVPACTVKWIGGWNGSVFVEPIPNGGATPKNFTTAPTNYPNLIITPNHGYIANQALVFYQGTPPGGITEGTTVYARDITADTFKVSATAGGVALALTTTPSFNCVVCAITETVYSTPGAHQLATFTQAVPD